MKSTMFELALRRLIPALALLAGGVAATSQEYYTVLDVGTTPDYSYTQSAAVLLSSPSNDRLSDWQPLPFAWHFFGRQVDAYRASDNGYISFDPAAEHSPAANTDLHAETAPRPAIFALWDDFHLAPGIGTPDEVLAWTYGTAPERVHVIQWRSVSQFPAAGGSDNNVSFAIRLYEQGDFDIVHNWGRTPAPLTASVGALDASGQRAIQVAGSPEYAQIPNSAAATDDRVIRFVQGSRPAVGLILKGLELPTAVEEGEDVQPAFRIVNYGRETIHSLSLDYSIDDMPPLSGRLDGLQIATNEAQGLSFPQNWTAVDGGRYHTLQLELTGINGGTAGLPPDVILSAPLLVYTGRRTPMRPLLEEFTGTWCAACPDGAVFIDRLRPLFPSLIAVAIHRGDAMALPLTEALADDFRPGYPQALLSRRSFGMDNIPVSRVDWQERLAELLAEGSSVSLAMDHSYNAAEQTATVRLTAGFLDYAPPADYRINLYIVEDGLAGEGRGWDQGNQYHNEAGHPYYGKGNPVIGYVHNDVVRAIPTGTWGAAGLIPTTPEVDKDYDWEYSFSLHEDWRLPQLRLVAFVSIYHGDSLKRPVLNAVEIPLLPTASEVGDGTVKHLQLQIEPNPISERAILGLHLRELRDLNVAVYDMRGQMRRSIFQGRLAAGEHRLALSAAGLAPGGYVVLVESGEFRRSVMIVVRP